MIITSKKYQDLVQDQINSSVNEQDLAVAEQLVATGSRVAEIEQSIATLNIERKVLNESVKEPAPRELKSAYLSAMSYGLSLQRYYDEILKEDNPWDLSLFSFPTTEGWQDLKRKARKEKEQRNLENVGDAVTILNDAVKNKKAVVTTCDVRALKSGGHSVKIHARCNEGEEGEALTFADLQQQIAEKRSRLSDSK